MKDFINMKDFIKKIITDFKKNKNKGVLTIEASIVLTLCVFFILLLFSFARIYSAQSVISHAVLQASDSVALESYLRELSFSGEKTQIINVANQISGESSPVNEANFLSLRSADLPKAAKEKFTYAVANTEEKADAKLKNLGVKNGLSGIDFSASNMDLGNDDVIIHAQYTVKMQFPFFGFKEIEMTKSAKSKTFGDILFGTQVVPEDPNKGSAYGSGNYKYGTKVKIEAEANYGYKFSHWDDGNTENPRTIIVNPNKEEYTAFFEPLDFGVNITVDKAEYGSVTGDKDYKYLDVAIITATPKNEHYYFEGWDDNGDGIVDNTEHLRSITVDKTYHFTAIFKPKKYTISVKVNDERFGTATLSQGEYFGTSILADYGTTVELIALEKEQDKKIYKFNKWSNNSTSSTQIVTVEGNAEYIAEFIYNTYTVEFYNGDIKFHETKVLANKSIDESKSIVELGSAMPPNNPAKENAQFRYWEYNKKEFTDHTPVTANIRVNALYGYKITLDTNGGSLSSSPKEYFVNHGESTEVLPKPVKQGYKFDGWKFNGTTYKNGTQIANVTSSMVLVAQWSKCKNHVWGRCGVMHYMKVPFVMNEHSTHEVYEFQCRLCVDCGTFDGGTCNCKNRYYNRDKTKISKVHLCFWGPSGKTWGCQSLWELNCPSPNYVYNIHEEIGYP